MKGAEGCHVSLLQNSWGNNEAVPGKEPKNGSSLSRRSIYSNGW
jgi:hypothetical protein